LGEETPPWRGKERATNDLLKRIIAKNRTIEYACPGSDELRYLDKMGVNANVGGERLTHILLREDPRTIEVWEEFLHGTQSKRGLIEKFGIPECERRVKKFMIRHAKYMKITDDDIVVLQYLLGGL